MKMPSQRRRRLRGGLVSLVLLAGAVYAVHAAATPKDPVDYGPSAGWTRSELRELTERGMPQNPVLLPQVLPAGVDSENGSFLAGNPITSRGRHAGRHWLTTYVVDALPPARGNISGYSVYQEWLAAPRAHRPPCGSRRVPNAVVTRRVGDDRLTICLGPHPTDTARTYWRTVPFTDDLETVAWLPEPHQG